MDSITKDFIVGEQHVKPISDILLSQIDKDIWESIASEFLNQRMLNLIPESKSFVQQLRASIFVWVNNTPNDQRRFSVLVAAINAHDNPTAEKLEDNCILLSKLEEEPKNRVQKTKEQILLEKWWPEEKFLIVSHHERKMANTLIIENIHKILEQHHDKKTVISQKATVSGMGGVGKTTTAIWFATHYEQEYDHIIWVDCGEGALFKSFKQLAMDLKIENTEDESNLKKLVSRVFLALSDSNCLFIYDNAECYIGSEGVNDVLPVNKSNIHCLITSRSSSWEDEYGEIPNIQLESFNSEDSVAFLKKNLRNTKYHEPQLIDLSTILGNLPLALQICVAAFNENERISIEEYIQNVKTAKDVLHSTALLDENEVSIINTLTISLESIKQKPRVGATALKILAVFSYISPDNIRADYFAEIDNIPMKEIEDAIALLQSYSLISQSNKKSIVSVTIEDKNFFKKLMNKVKKIVSKEVTVVSIHRLLQQVIRYNGRKAEMDTLRRILKCKGFIDYKLIPYRYAEKNAALKKEFYSIRAQLIEQLDLMALWNEQRFTEAAQLSRLIHEGIPKKKVKLLIPSLYNHAISLWRNGEVPEAMEHIKTLLKYLNLFASRDSDDEEYCELVADDSDGNDSDSLSSRVTKAFKMVSHRIRHGDLEDFESDDEKEEIDLMDNFGIVYDDFKLVDIKTARWIKVLVGLCVQLQRYRKYVGEDIMIQVDAVVKEVMEEGEIIVMPC